MDDCRLQRFQPGLGLFDRRDLRRRFRSISGGGLFLASVVASFCRGLRGLLAIAAAASAATPATTPTPTLLTLFRGLAMRLIRLGLDFGLLGNLALRGAHVLRQLLFARCAGRLLAAVAGHDRDLPRLRSLATPPAAPAAARRATAILFLGMGLFFLAALLFGFFLALECPVHADGTALRLALRFGSPGRLLDGEVRALHLVARLHCDRDAVPGLHLVDESALVVEDVKRDRCRGLRDDRRRRSRHQRVLHAADNSEGDGLGRADDAGALAMRALRGGPFEHTRPEPLA